MSKFRASNMGKISNFDLLKLPNLISRKVWVSESEKFGYFYHFQMWKFIQNDQSCSCVCIFPKITKFYFTFHMKSECHKIECCKLACPGMYSDVQGHSSWSKSKWILQLLVIIVFGTSLLSSHVLVASLSYAKASKVLAVQTMFSSSLDDNSSSSYRTRFHRVSTRQRPSMLSDTRRKSCITEFETDLGKGNFFWQTALRVKKEMEMTEKKKMF